MGSGDLQGSPPGNVWGRGKKTSETASGWRFRDARASLQQHTTVKFLTNVPWLQSIFNSNSEASEVIASLIT